MNSYKKRFIPKPYKEICVISDLDDTLLNSSHEISLENLEAICEFIDKGGEFGLATGRGAQSVARLNIPVTLPAILYNGSCIMDVQSGQLYWNRPLDSSVSGLVENLLERFSEIAIEIFTFKGIYLISENQESRKHIALEHITPLSLNGNYTEISVPWQKILLAWDSENLNSVESYLSSSDCSGYSIKFHRSYDFLVEIIHPDCGKEIALQQLSCLFQIPMEKIIAIGDNQNDLAFIKCAGRGIAAGNALTTVKNAADYITVDHDQHIMAELLRLLNNKQI